MKKNTIVLLLSLMLLTNCNIEEKNNKELKNTSELRFYKALLSSSFSNNNIILNNTVVYYGTDTINKYRLDEVIQANCLIVRINGENCHRCIDFTLNSIKDIFKDFNNNENIKVLCCKTNPIVKNGYYGKKLISLYQNQELGLPIEKTGLPFIFLTDSNLKTNMFFIPDKNHPKLTQEYLRIIKRTFQHKECPTP